MFHVERQRWRRVPTHYTYTCTFKCLNAHVTFQRDTAKFYAYKLLHKCLFFSPFSPTFYRLQCIYTVQHRTTYIFWGRKFLQRNKNGFKMDFIISFLKRVPPPHNVCECTLMYWVHPIHIWMCVLRRHIKSVRFYF